VVVVDIEIDPEGTEYIKVKGESALKIISKKDLCEDEYNVIKNEAIILQRMEHPNIVEFN
jgi:hypothetical protein